MAVTVPAAYAYVGKLYARYKSTRQGDDLRDVLAGKKARQLRRRYASVIPDSLN
jgi:hypothetical protein